jgi:hypothetical protein
MNAFKFFKLAVLTGVPFAILWGGFMRLTMGPQFGLGVAAATGMLFGLCIATFSAWMRKKLIANRSLLNLEVGEAVEHEGPANHWLGAEARGGWLYLTERRLSFRPHSINVQKDTVDLKRSEILGTGFKNGLGFIPNGLLVHTPAGTHHFVVEERARWKELIGTQQAGVVS